jgi:hypothetical protein
LNVRVFWNPTNALFHPKVARFGYPDGRCSMIVGSGNLTPGGLRQNFEAFSVMRAAANETLDLSSWDRFLNDHAADVRAIDAEALARAAQNFIRGRQRPARLPATGVGSEPPAGVVRPAGDTDRCLVAQIPRAGGRWHQVHFNIDVIEQFFRVRHGTEQRVFLIECLQDGNFGEEEVRPCVYSEANMNPKIEIASHHGDPYPDAGRPVAVFRELQTRTFVYMLLMPGEPGHQAMLALTERLDSIGRGLPRVITDSSGIRDAWPESPLIGAIGRRSEKPID